MTDIIPVDAEVQQLPQTLQAWKEVMERHTRLQEEMKELKKRRTVLEKSILTTMEKHQIGALDLKASNARLRSKKKQTKGALSQKDLHAATTEFLKNEDQANKLLAFLGEKKHVVEKTVLAYEKL